MVMRADAAPTAREGGEQLQQGGRAPEGAQRKLPGGQRIKAYGGPE